MMRCSLLLLLLTLGCQLGSQVKRGEQAVGAEYSTQPSVKMGPKSHHLYLLALRPRNAFQTESEREGLWRALRGEDKRIRNVLGDLEKIPPDYRVEYVFNHATPDAPEAELHKLKPLAARLSSSAVSKLEQSGTLLLVKGDLERLPQARELRLTLAGILYLSETYDGMIFDLLTREAMTAKQLRAKLESRRLGSQVRFIGAKLSGRRGVRTVGLPKYGLADLFVATEQPKSALSRLSRAVDSLLAGAPLDPNIRMSACRDTRLDFGCVEAQWSH